MVISGFDVALENSAIVDVSKVLWDINVVLSASLLISLNGVFVAELTVEISWVVDGLDVSVSNVEVLIVGSWSVIIGFNVVLVVEFISKVLISGMYTSLLIFPVTTSGESGVAVADAVVDVSVVETGPDV